MELPRHRGHRGEILAHALHTIGKSSSACDVAADDARKSDQLAAQPTSPTHHMPRTRGHRGEILGHALHDMGASVKEALQAATSPTHKDGERGPMSPKSPGGQHHDAFRHNHGSVRAGALSAVLARNTSMPALVKSFAAPNVARSLSSLKAAHKDGRKLSWLGEGGEVHRGHLKFHDGGHASWKHQWCVIGSDSTLYVCPDKGHESVCALPLGSAVIIDVCEKEMSHPLTIQIAFDDNGGSTESLMLRADNITDKRSWTRALQHACAACRSG